MILKSLNERKLKKSKSLSVLIDPDKIKDVDSFSQLLSLCVDCKVDYILVGGSLLIQDSLEETISSIKEQTDIPLILFPGSNLHIDKSADAILFLSLISGRNPEMLFFDYRSQSLHCWYY